ncbi:MAG: hypothetical protein HQK52_00095 [Oligoflexia bacterium]|nr:hypothetical protein [Oligoflexia bacterium]
MKCALTILTLTLFFPLAALAQDLWQEKIVKVSPVKRGVFSERFIFFKNDTFKGEEDQGVLGPMRQFYTEGSKQERIVLDITGVKSIPSVYGFVAGDERRIHIDIFNVEASTNMASLGKSRFVKSMKVYPIGKDHLSIELELDRNLSFEVFYLTNPVRLVVDAKEGSTTRER